MKFTPLLPDLGMKTEIKFRAWDKKARTMIPWELILKECDRLSFLSQDGFVVEQYTGLNDSKGKEIYANDKLQLDYGTVHLAGVAKQADSGEWELYKDEDSHVGIHHNKRHIEIIGNIHEK